ncbi:MAG: FtsX-like permease family protein [Bacteroidota bacterium]
MNTRIKKIFRDLTTDIPKNLMLISAMMIGVFGIGAVLGGYAVLEREMAKNYLSTNPAAATIKAEGTFFTRELIDSLRKFDGVRDVERHATISARMKIGGDWYPLLLFVIDDFSVPRTNIAFWQSGAATPPLGSMLVERTVYRVIQASEGTEIVIKTPNGKQKAIRISGTVHDPSLAPAWQEQTGYGYITLSTLHWLGEIQEFDELRFTAAQPEIEREDIGRTAKKIAAWLTRKGFAIHEVQIPPPRKHPHQGQMNAVLSLFTIFSFMVLVLSSILVASSFATLMVKQIREIGVMKTIGANSRQIAGLYLLMVVLLSIIATGMGIVLSRFAAAVLYSNISVLLNLRIFDPSIPWWVMGVQAAAGLLIPLAAVAFPVLRGSRITVRKAIDNYGISTATTSSGNAWLATISQWTMMGETFVLSLRNTFRDRSRLMLTLGLLSAGGAMFMTSMNVSKAWDNSLGKITQQRFYDLDVRLHHFVPTVNADSVIKGITGIRSAERWGYSSTSYVLDVPYDIVQTYPDKGHGSFQIVGVPLPTSMISLPIIEGRWLNAKDSGAVVLNHIAHALSPSLKIGDSIRLSIDAKPTSWKIVGFAEDLYSPATAYVSMPAFQSAACVPDRFNMLKLAFAGRENAGIAEKTRLIEEALAMNNVSVQQNISAVLFRNAISEHMGVLVNSLLAMAILMALVGALGLTSTMSMNILERKREIGVMRAIGASPKTISNLVLVEGLIAGIMSIFFAFFFSLILSFYLGEFIGSMAFRSPLSLTVSQPGIFLWIIIILFGSLAATYFPARSASRITTREALAYE